MYSRFGAGFAAKSGTRQLMDDLGEVARGGAGLINLGGGNPALIPALQAQFETAWAAVPTREWLRILSGYDAPQGHQAFLEVLAHTLHTGLGWPVSARNFLVTGGSQASFFLLFNLFGGTTATGQRKQILLPQAPEYIGYAQSGVEPDMLRSYPALIERVSAHRFKYHPDFAAITVDERCGAVCVSRPCNPTGNVLSDADLGQLRGLARQAGVPLIVDCAYGEPFPGISFVPTTLQWDQDLVVCLSLSKLGLPGVRTGLVIASEATIEVLTSLHAMLTLSVNPVGGRLALELMRNTDLLALGREIIAPHYAAHSATALALCDELLAGTDYLVHLSQGAIFLWLWFPSLKVPVQVLYEALKARGVLVIPGHHFGPGLATPWPHLTQCLRISYAQPEATLRLGLTRLAQTLQTLA